MIKWSLALMMYGFLSAHAVAADRGFFNCFKVRMTPAQLEDMADWFGGDGVRQCCDLYDGMPGFAEDRPDGTYIAPLDVMLPIINACRDHPDQPMAEPPADHSNWVWVDSSRILRKNNPIGVVVVWWRQDLKSAQRAIINGRVSRWSPRCVAKLVEM